MALYLNTMSLTRKQKIAKVKKDLRGRSFNIPIEDLPDIPEEFSLEIINFICYHIGALCKTDAMEFISYMMFILSERELEDLLFNLWIIGIDIDEYIPLC